MKKNKENKPVKRSNHFSNNKTKAKNNSEDKNSIAMPEEFEEDRSMNIRMKPQPYLKRSKK